MTLKTSDGSILFLPGLLVGFQMSPVSSESPESWGPEKAVDRACKHLGSLHPRGHVTDTLDHL
jgi:hypothetical protein